MRETSPEAALAIERTNAALAEAEQARADYDAWMAAWRARRGHLGAFDPDTGLPLADRARALAGTEAQP